MSQGTNEICDTEVVKMFEERGNVDVVGRVAGSTAVAENRIAGDSDGLNSKLFGKCIHTHTHTHTGIALNQLS
jgi:hypothetical protein